MCTRAIARIRFVLTEHGQAVLGRLRVQYAKDLLQVLVHGKQALFTRLIFDAVDHSSRAVDGNS